MDLNCANPEISDTVYHTHRMPKWPVVQKAPRCDTVVRTLSHHDEHVTTPKDVCYIIGLMAEISLKSFPREGGLISTATILYGLQIRERGSS